MTMIITDILSSVLNFIEIIIYTATALLMLIVTFGILRQSRDAFKQRYEIRRRMFGSI